MTMRHSAEPATSAPVIAAAPQRLAFQLRHALRNRRLTKLAVTDLTMRADLRVIVECPTRRGTKITVRARAGALTATRSITIRSV